ncbi:MAG TPA: ABC transporter permease [Opitutaceae bacterium]|nr:ABC transporter permease [Opitutaceae bacterium]
MNAPIEFSSAMPEVVIEPEQSSRNYWRDLWHFRELLFFLAWRDVKVRYKQAVLGAAWALLQPVVTMVLFTFVFGKLAKMPSGNTPYPLLVLSGLLPWQLFSAALSGSSGSLVSNSNLISKVYFPRLIVPLSALAVALVDFTFVLALYAGASGWFHVWPTWRLALLPVFVLLALLIALGAGLWLTALTVKYRDFRFIVPFLLQVGVFVTPVGFRTDFLPNWRPLLALNPLTGAIDGFRWCLLGSDFHFSAESFFLSLTTAAILLATGLWYFRATERTFADII